MEEWLKNLDPNEIDDFDLTPAQVASNPSLVESQPQYKQVISSPSTVSLFKPSAVNNLIVIKKHSPLLNSFSPLSKQNIKLSTLINTSTPAASNHKQVQALSNLALKVTPISKNEDPSAFRIDSFSTTFKSPHCTELSHSIVSSISNADDLELRIFADRHEVSHSHIISNLRIKHNVTVQICSLKFCHYVVSSRMAIIRQSQSDLTNSHTLQKIIDQSRGMCDLYERCCIIIEKDKQREKRGSVIFTTKQASFYSKNIVRLLISRLMVLFSTSELHTVSLLLNVTKQEVKKGYQISDSLLYTEAPLFKFYISIPKLNPIISINMCQHRGYSLAEIVVMNVEQIKQIISGISHEQATTLVAFFSHSYNQISFKSKIDN